MYNFLFYPMDRKETFMKQSENTSIRKRIRNLLFTSILFFTFMGCSLVIVIFVNVFRSEKTKQIETIMHTLYNEAVIETQERVGTQAKSLSELLKQNYELEEFSNSTQNDLEKIFPKVKFSIYDLDYQLLFTTSEDVFTTYEDAFALKQQDSIFLGNQDLGIYYFKKVAIHNQSNELIGYVIVHDKVTQQGFIDYIKDEFHADATIFYKDVRIVTTVKNDHKEIVGTKLNRELAAKILEEPSAFSGIAFILDKPYLTAYKSFGNQGEAPLGIIFVGESLLQYSKTLVFVFIAILLLGVFLFLLSIRFSGRWIEKNIVQPILNATDLITEIVDGDRNASKSMESNVYYNEFENLLDSIKKILGSLKKSKRETELIAYYDQLTNLPNRFNLFRKNPNTQEFDQQLSSLILFDLDDLKTVNELYGAKIGDILIEEIGKFISLQLKKDYDFKCYRIGGGTFALIIEVVTDTEKIRSIVESLMQRFTSPFVFDDVSLKVTISVGIAIRIRPEETMEELLYHAELAMTEVKKALKNDYMFYKPEISDNIRKRKEMEVDLKNAIDRNEFFLVYQPKYNLKTKQFDSFEALIRWDNPKCGLVPPVDFIDLAEESGLIVPIGNWVLEEASRTVKRISKKLNFPYKVAVNISPIQINRDDFFKTICETLMNSELDSSQLELEITENLLMSSFSTAVEKLRQLYVLGVSISVDDFGKGYSSLAYLQELPIHTLKIDKLFIDVIKDNEETMVGDIIRLGHNMNLMVIAEGVENSIQRDYLELSGCDMIQGYYYSKPLTSDKLEVFLEKQKG